MARTRRDNAARTTLTPRAIVEQAIAMADAEGLAAVTIRRLARDLGVTPMALYWHFRSKDELLDGMAARLLEAVDPPVDGSLAWQDQLRATLESLVAVLRAHPSTARLLPTRTVSSDGSLRATETLLDILRHGGFSPKDATQIARHALTTIANLAAAPSGAVAWDESEGTADARRDARESLQALPPERYPRLIEAAEPLSEGIDPDAYVAFGVDLLLAGIEAMAPRP